MNQRFINILCEHIEMHPLAQAVDIYKLLYQAANGPRHLLKYGIDILQLRQQWDDALLGNEPALESISADGQLVRAHFAKLRESGISFDDVWNALMLTAEGFQPQPKLLIRWWYDLGELIEAKVVKISADQYRELDDEFNLWGFVTKHHSEQFVRAYKPAYVVVLKRYIEGLLFAGAADAN